MTDLRERAKRMAHELTETVARAGYLPQNRTYSALEVADFRDTLAEDIAIELRQVQIRAHEDALSGVVGELPEPDIRESSEWKNGAYQTRRNAEAMIRSLIATLQEEQP